MLGPLEREPLWLQAAVDQRIAFMKEMTGGITGMAKAAGTPIIMTFLKEPAGESEAQFIHWEKSCDNCDKFSYFNTIPGCVERMVDDIRIVIAFGMCPQCAELP